MDRKQVLMKANELITGDRQEQYGDASDSFTRIAVFWSAYLDQIIAPEDVAVMMCLLKCSRLSTDHKHEDGWIDLAGYAALGAELSTSHAK